MTISGAERTDNCENGGSRPVPAEVGWRVRYGDFMRGNTMAF